MKKVSFHGHSGERLRYRKWILPIAALLVVALIPCAYYIGRSIETSGHKNVRGDPNAYATERPGIEYNGVRYTLKDGMTTILFMGIDADTDGAVGDFRSGGQADFLYLWAVDHKGKTIYQCAIDRDTLTDIVVLGVLGNEAGTRKAQISLSHGFGDGREKSCEYTVRAASYLLDGINIDYYMAFDMSSIGALNDALGGVEVTIEDDLSAINPEMTVGAKVKLNAEQAELFVRARMEVGEGDNASRMRRQSAFLRSAISTARAAISENESFAGSFYDTLKETMVTDMSKGRLINEVSKASGYVLNAPFTPEGEHAVSTDGFMEFHADAESITKWVVDTFYQQ